MHIILILAQHMVSQNCPQPMFNGAVFYESDHYQLYCKVLLYILYDKYRTSCIAIWIFDVLENVIPLALLNVSYLSLFNIG